jgi:hypothetical protein
VATVAQAPEEEEAFEANRISQLPAAPIVGQPDRARQTLDGAGVVGEDKETRSHDWNGGTSATDDLYAEARKESETEHRRPSSETELRVGSRSVGQSDLKHESKKKGRIAGAGDTLEGWEVSHAQRLPTPVEVAARRGSESDELAQNGELPRPAKNEAPGRKVLALAPKPSAPPVPQVRDQLAAGLESREIPEGEEAAQGKSARGARLEDKDAGRGPAFQFTDAAAEGKRPSDASEYRANRVDVGGGLSLNGRTRAADEAGAVGGKLSYYERGFIKDEETLAGNARFQDVLARFGYGVLDYRPEEWRHVTLERPIYFENTYLGGNARLALLDHLAGRFEQATGALTPHRLARVLPQHFDPPTEGGMALRVDLDRASVAHGERSRIFLQVGLAGGDNPAWRRPPLSLGVLVLTRNPDALVRAAAAGEALKSGLEDQDAFALLGPGRPFRFVSPAEAGDPNEQAAAPADFGDADLARLLREVSDAFAAAEGPGSLRNRRLVLVTDVELGEQARRAVHRLGLEDVATSVISLDESRFASHARAALAGMGNLHVARSADQARRVARDELGSLTRVVARAVRLNIRPARRVKLIQVLGSRPLTQIEKRRVKATELAIDRRVEATTGIARDRGGDDPGLQTVIPYFYGGDEHVVMVELEVEGPGPVAEVSLKYKDLVDMKNQTLRSSAALSRRPLEETSRNEQVRRNLFSFAVAQVLGQLEAGLGRGGIDPQGLGGLESLIAAARGDLAPGGANGAQADALHMLEQYARLVAEGTGSGDLASSLEYARLAVLGRSRR